MVQFHISPLIKLIRGKTGNVVSFGLIVWGNIQLARFCYDRLQPRLTECEVWVGSIPTGPLEMIVWSVLGCVQPRVKMSRDYVTSQ
jgi:hypothetical protein